MPYPLYQQKCRQICGLGCVNRVQARARVTQPSPHIFLHICTSTTRSIYTRRFNCDNLVQGRPDRLRRLPQDPQRAALQHPHVARRRQRHPRHSKGKVLDFYPDLAGISNVLTLLNNLQVRMGDEDDYVCEVNLKDAPISITHHLEVLGECSDYKNRDIILLQLEFLIQEVLSLL